MNRYHKSAIILAVVFELIIIYTGSVYLLYNNYEGFKLSLLAAVSILIPFIIYLTAKRTNLDIPQNFQLFGVLFIFTAQYFGEINKFYELIWWWDLMLHGAFGSYAVFTFHYIVKKIIRKEIEISQKKYKMTLSLISFCFAVALGALWEIFEFSGDFLFNTCMVKGGLEDTMSDLIIKTTTALITSLIYYKKN